MQSYNPLDTVLFGLDVLVDIDHGRAFGAWADAVDGNVSEIEHSITESGVIDALERGELDSDEFLDQIKEMVGSELSDDDALNGWMEAVGDPLEGMVAFVEKLSVSLRVALVANTNPLHDEVLRERAEPIVSLVETVFASHEIGARTDDDALFETVLDSLEVDPDDVAFFDTSSTALLTATSMGMRSFEAGDAETMRSELDPLIDSIPDSR